MRDVGTRGGPAEFAEQISAAARDAAGKIRRMAITLTTRALWQVLGHLLIDGTPETHDAEVFSGVGFYSRPPTGSKPEAIVVFPGGPGNPTIIATRDEATRKASVGNGTDDIAAMFNTVAIVMVKADGTIELRSVGGSASFVALTSDLATLKSAISGAAVVAGDGGAAFKANILAALSTWPVGATKVKAE
jgi:phage gp45-like